MKKLFVIRDDDLNFFSKPEDIEYWYKELISGGIPVSFSTVPFVKKTSDVYTGDEEGKNKNGEYPIGENRELVEYIKHGSRNIEIMQHGYTHETVEGVYEFKKKSEKSDLFKQAKRGLNYLESFFGKINVFVAPHDSISNHGIKVVESLGLNIIRSKGSRNFIWRPLYITALTKMVIHRLKHRDRYLAPAYPYVVNFGMHKEAYSHRLVNDKELLKKWLYFSAKKRGNFILVNHLHDKDEKLKEVLFFLIEEAKTLGFSFVKANELFGK